MTVFNGGMNGVKYKIVFVAVLFVLFGCGGSASKADDARTATSSDSSVAETRSTTNGSDSSSPSLTVPPGSVPSSASTRDRLAVLVIDDRPSPQGDYRREDWPHWADIDGNGCDARQDALIAWATAPATVNRVGTCKVVAGSWVSPYDLFSSNNAGDFDVDHLVPLANAFLSGGWRWDAGRRRLFANSPAELVVASANSNRSKGADPPDQWRPNNRDSWCAYADGWVSVKATWGLSVTTSERDALGQMLDTCGLAGAVWPLGGGGSYVAPAPSAPDSGGAEASSGSPPGGDDPAGDVYYANCTAARAAGAAPLYRGAPGYRSALDRDGDGIACE